MVKDKTYAFFKHVEKIGQIVDKNKVATRKKLQIAEEAHLTQIPNY